MSFFYHLGRGVGRALAKARRSHEQRVASRSGDPAARMLRSVEFTIGVIALSAKMAKADGTVTADEVEAFRRLFRPSEGEMNEVARAYERARHTTLGFEGYARRLGRLFADHPKILEDLLDALFYIARADGRVDEKELVFLHKVARSFGFSDGRFAAIRARNLGTPQDDPHAVLGVSPDIGADELHRHYLKLVRANHPDRLQAEGVPESFRKVASDRLARINAAYERIRAMRAAQSR